jgi:hypothetical protein
MRKETDGWPAGGQKIENFFQKRRPLLLGGGHGGSSDFRSWISQLSVDFGGRPAAPSPAAMMTEAKRRWRRWAALIGWADTSSWLPSFSGFVEKLQNGSDWLSE